MTTALVGLDRTEEPNGPSALARMTTGHPVHGPSGVTGRAGPVPTLVASVRLGRVLTAIGPAGRAPTARGPTGLVPLAVANVRLGRVLTVNGRAGRGPMVSGRAGPGPMVVASVRLGRVLTSIGPAGRAPTARGPTGRGPMVVASGDDRRGPAVPVHVRPAVVLPRGGVRRALRVVRLRRVRSQLRRSAPPRCVPRGLLVGNRRNGPRRRRGSASSGSTTVRCAPSPRMRPSGR